MFFEKKQRTSYIYKMQIRRAVIKATNVAQSYNDYMW